MLQPVRKQSLSEAVFEQLRDQIVDGRMGPGLTLPAERALCDMLKVNRSAVREALKRLEQAQLVAIQHGGSTRVLDYRETASMDLLADLLLMPDGTLDDRVVRSVIEMRSALAPDIARLAALRASKESAFALGHLAAQMATAGNDLDRLQELNIQFWNVLVTASDNVAYQLAYNSLRKTYAKFQHALTEVLANELSDLASYAAIAKAVQKSDGRTAERRARVLVRRGAARLMTMLNALARREKGEAQ